jgi:hypothetical protein
MGPGKILSGIKDVTEKVLITSANFVVDGPVDIRFDLVFSKVTTLNSISLTWFFVQMVRQENISYAHVS